MQRFVSVSYTHLVDHFGGGIVHTKADVVGDGIREEEVVLWNIGAGTAHRMDGQMCIRDRHGLLIELCGNSLLESMYARIHSLNQQFRIYSLTSTQRFNESMEEHRDIVHCLLTNNADEARAINKRHLQLAKDRCV